MIPSIPNIPTDNFYKFQTFISAIVFVSLFGLLTYVSLNLETKISDLKKQTDIINYKAKYLNQEINDANDSKLILIKYLYEKNHKRKFTYEEILKDLDSISTDNDTIFKSSSMKLSYYRFILKYEPDEKINYVFQEIVKLDSIINEHQKEIEENLIIKFNLIYKSERIIKRNDRDWTVIVILLIISSFSMCIGFIKWYKYQLIQDKILNLTLKKLQQETDAQETKNENTKNLKIKQKYNIFNFPFLSKK